MENFSVRFETFWNVLVNEGGYKDVIEGLKNTMYIAVVGLVIGIVIGTLIATIRVLPKYKFIVRALDSACKFYVGVFRGTPMVVQLLVFYYVLIPLLTPFLEFVYCENIVPYIEPAVNSFFDSFMATLNSQMTSEFISETGVPYIEPAVNSFFDSFMVTLKSQMTSEFISETVVPFAESIKDSLLITSIRIPSVNVAVLVFGLNSGAYISEIMRAGILSVDPGQLEGARSVGFSFSAAMIKVVIPQAIKNILPTLGNEFIALVKETSVVSFVGAMDLYLAFQRIGAGTYEFMIPYLAMAVVYIVIICLISLGVKIMERSLRKGDRK